MTVRVKANRSSEFINNMGCRQCKSEEVESQEHLETCAGTKDLRKNLDMTNDYMIFWRKISKKLRDMIKNEETEELKNKLLQRNSVHIQKPNKKTNAKAVRVSDPSESRQCHRAR